MDNGRLRTWYDSVINNCLNFYLVKYESILNIELENDDNQRSSMRNAKTAKNSKNNRSKDHTNKSELKPLNKKMLLIETTSNDEQNEQSSKYRPDTMSNSAPQTTTMQRRI